MVITANGEARLSLPPTKPGPLPIPARRADEIIGLRAAIDHLARAGAILDSVAIGTGATTTNFDGACARLDEAVAALLYPSPPDLDRNAGASQRVASQLADVERRLGTEWVDRLSVGSVKTADRIAIAWRHVHGAVLALQFDAAASSLESGH